MLMNMLESILRAKCEIYIDKIYFDVKEITCFDEMLCDFWFVDLVKAVNAWVLGAFGNVLNFELKCEFWRLRKNLNIFQNF